MKAFLVLGLASGYQLIPQHIIDSNQHRESLGLPKDLPTGPLVALSRAQEDANYQRWKSEFANCFHKGFKAAWENNGEIDTYTQCLTETLFFKFPVDNGRVESKDD